MSTALPTPPPTWRDETKVAEYLGRIGRLEARAEGERELVAALPADVRRVLDLGCGDGRLIDVVRAARPGVEQAIGLDVSPPMLARARANHAGDPVVEIVEHDLRSPLPVTGPFDAVVSGFAIHHLSHERKRALFAEVVDLLRPGGVFVNLEVVRCATDTLHTEFETLIGRPGGDPEDVLAGLDEQLGWMRDSGLADVDCQWRWRGFAVLTGRGVGGWRNTKQLHRLEPPVAVELLVFEVRTDAFAAWQVAEHEHWTLALADRFPAMLDKQTWVQDLGEWQRVSVVIGWRSVEEWQAIDTGWLDEQEARLVAAVGADAYRLVHAGHEGGVHWYRTSEYR